MVLDGATREALLAALAMQVEFGADEAIADSPFDRFAERDPAPEPAHSETRRQRAPAAPAAPEVQPSGAEAAEAVAARCRTLPELAAALAAFDAGALKAGATRCVFADGQPGARVMIVGEAPGRDEDLAGKPFVGRSGQLLDRMLACIGLDRTAEDPSRAVYITNVLPWRPLSNRTPAADEVALMLPFLRRHIALAAPAVLVPMGGSAVSALLGGTGGITRRRGRWARLDGLTAQPLPVLPMLHPAYLLRTPAAKRQAWRDLLSLRAMLDGEPPSFEG